MDNEVLQEVASALLPYLRNYLDITWEDEAGDKKLTGIIARGILYINRLAGEDITYINDDKPVQSKGLELLCEYCRYVRSNALEDFERNFLPELTALQIDYMVERVVEDGD